MTARVGCEGDGIAEGDYEPHATTLDYVVAAAVACLTGTLGGMLASTGQPLDDGELVADGEADLVKEAGTIGPPPSASTAASGFPPLWGEERSPHSRTACGHRSLPYESNRHRHVTPAA